MMRKLKADVWVIGCVLLTAFLFLFIPCLMPDLEAASVVIIQDGAYVAEYDLSEDKTVPVSSENGGYNLILIEQGRVKVTDADCPDKLCVKQREISRNGESIICLPHKLVVQIVSKEESDLDAVTN